MFILNPEVWVKEKGRYKGQVTTLPVIRQEVSKAYTIGCW